MFAAPGPAGCDCRAVQKMPPGTHRLLQSPLYRGRDSEQYQEYISSVSSILKGDVTTVRKLLESQMKAAFQAFNFELAQRYKEQWEMLTRYQAKSVIVNSRISNLDVFSLTTDAGSSMAFGNFMRVADGAVIQSLNVKYKLHIERRTCSRVEFVHG